MVKKIDKIMKDLETLDASSGENRKNMKKTVEELIRSKPDTRFRSSFKNRLEKELLSRGEELSGKGEVKSRIRPFTLKRSILAGSIAAAVLAGFFFIPLYLSKEDREVKQLATRYKREVMPSDRLEREERIVEKRYQPPKAADGIFRQKHSSRRGKRIARGKASPPPEPSITGLREKKKLSKDLFGGLGSGVADKSDDLSGYSIARAPGKERKKALKSAEESEAIATIRDQKKEEPASLPFNTEEYSRIYENEFLDAGANPLSTFSIDVDTASYSNTRRFLTGNRLPPRDAVRIEEFINYFSYDYPVPRGDTPFSITTETGACPWNGKNRLVHIGIKGKELPESQLPPSNLVFLIDVSGSMNSPDKLGLLKRGFRMLVDALPNKSRVAIVVYAGATGLVLPSTPATEKKTITGALERLQAGGPTAGSAGIRLAYAVAKKYYIPGGNNRIIIATDGDFNVGPSSQGELTRLVEEKRKEGIFLTVLGFGGGNYKDSRMEAIADRGNGSYAYIDSILEAKKVMVTGLRSTLFTIARDVKIQVEFNPAYVRSYRLIGYENRMLKKEDFNDDTKDAGELGAGHTVTALYEIVPAGGEPAERKTDPLKYQETRIRKSAAGTGELMTVKLRYKKPEGGSSRLIVKSVRDSGGKRLSNNFRFSAAVAEFGMLLRKSRFRGSGSYKQVRELGEKSLGKDRFGYRREFLRLVRMAELLDK